MSDTTKTILWIVLALVIIAAIIWFFVAGARRRAHEARHVEPAELRAPLQERTPEVRRSPEAPVDEPAPQPVEVATAAPAGAAEPLVERGSFGRPAPAPTATVAAAGGALVGADAFTREDDEPDLADAENPFATTGSEPTEPPESTGPAVPSRAAESQPEPDPSEDADWVNGPVNEPSDEEFAAERAEDREAADWVNGPEEEQGTASEAKSEGSEDADWVNAVDDAPSDEEYAAEAAEDREAADWINGPEDEQSAASGDSPESSGPDVYRRETENRPAPESAELPETVEVPALEDRDEVIVGGGTPADDPGDHRGQPWSTSMGTPAPPAADVAADKPARSVEPVDEETPDVGETPDAEEGPDAQQPENPGPIEHSDEAPLLDEEAGTDEGDVGETDNGGTEDGATDTGDEASVRERRISAFEEVRDGGFGIGSAAPIEDGAQPLGHAVKASRGSGTFLAPGAEGYDDLEPDVWFFNEEAARRAGFHPVGE